VFNVSGSAVSAQSQRLNVVASNLANADRWLTRRPAVQGAPGRVPDHSVDGSDPAAAGVRVAKIVEDNARRAASSIRVIRWPTRNGLRDDEAMSTWSRRWST